MTLQATITAKYVNNTPGKKRNTVRDTEDQYWGVFGPLIAQFQPGQTYRVTYDEQVVNGETYRNIKAASPAMPPAQQADQQQPKPQQNGNGHYRPRDPTQSEQIFVLAILKEGIRAGQVEFKAEIIEKYVQALRSVYVRTFGQAEMVERNKAASH